eukprot:NODE_2173_length_1183_cov_1103.540564_g766_i1.p1 GENE.NODE_2173_length_1183_cov_1103.540564_g766_i1~~NODE_2173_length_1183_cov_1103.540564_g766_i1.p1  ORF type:complete len:211 (+),score=53.03 NODE_2173_length_1183_cov_1103.540564_g766_i1:492-1124(+)
MSISVQRNTGGLEAALRPEFGPSPLPPQGQGIAQFSSYSFSQRRGEEPIVRQANRMWASDGAGAAQQAYSMFGNHEGGFQGIQRSLGDQSVSMERGAPFGQGPAFQSTHGNVETFMPGWRSHVQEHPFWGSHMTAPGMRIPSVCGTCPGSSGRITAGPGQESLASPMPEHVLSPLGFPGSPMNPPVNMDQGSGRRVAAGGGVPPLPSPSA